MFIDIKKITNIGMLVATSKLKNDTSLKFQMVTFAATRSDISEPKTYRTTLKIPHWLKAMQEEIKALIQNRTWDLVPRPPTANIVGLKWVFKTKLKEDRTIDRYKTCSRFFSNTKFRLWRDIQPSYKAYYKQIDHFASNNLGVDNETVAC